MEYIGFALAFAVGVSLGLIGSGGSILTVPILVYIIGIEAVAATGYSLFVVGVTALVGAVRNAMAHQVDFRAVAAFGIPSLIAAFVTRAFLIPVIPEVLMQEPFVLSKGKALLLLFGIVMAFAALKMIRSKAPEPSVTPASAGRLTLTGVFTGILAGAVGAGGGFLIIPALVFLAALPMKKAIGSSLTIIAIQSLAGFAGDVGHLNTDWNFLLPFSASAIAGILMGMVLAKRIPGEKLKVAFGYFVLVMAGAILATELLRGT